MKKNHTRRHGFLSGRSQWILRNAISLLLWMMTAANAASNLPAPHIIAYEFMDVPGTLGGSFSSGSDGPVFENVDISDSGAIVFRAQVADWESAYEGIYRYELGTRQLELVLRSGQAIGAGGFVLTNIGRFRFSSAGQLLVQGTFQDASGEVFGIQLVESAGQFHPLFYTDDFLDRNGDYEATIGSTYLNVDQNANGILVLHTTPSYVKPEPYPALYFSTGVFIKRSPTAAWERVLQEGELLPGGVYLGRRTLNDRIFINHRGDICLPTRTRKTPGGSSTGQAVLYRTAGGVWQSILANGNPVTYLSNGVPVEFTIARINDVDVNAHGQVGMLVTDNHSRKHLLLYANEKVHRIAGDGDRSPTAPTRFGSTLTRPIIFTIDRIPTFRMSNGQFPLAEKEAFLPEVVFTYSVIPNSPFFRATSDVYAFTYGQRISPVLLGKAEGEAGSDEGTPAPTPPGGTLNFENAELAMNADGRIAVHSQTILPGELGKREVIVVTSLDKDGDGLLDMWEEEGLDVNGDGTVDLDLKGLGANPDRKDLFVEIDYMEDPATGHSHRPDTNALQRVVDAFRNAPVENPCGTNGIWLHVEMDQADSIPHQDALRVPVDWNTLSSNWFGRATDRTGANAEMVLKARRSVMRYCIFAHQYSYYDKSSAVWIRTTSSGLAECPGNDFLVSLGAFGADTGTPEEQAATFMHELGHTLGLRHGGNDSVNCKPNYLSIMSYSRQFNDLIPDRPLDYSRSALPVLDETGLDERLGVGAGAADKSVFFLDKDGDGTNDAFYLFRGNQRVDWNRNGITADSDVAQDINSCLLGYHDGKPQWLDHVYGALDSGRQVLCGHHDWSCLQYSFRHSPSYAGGVDLDSDHMELTSEAVEAMRQMGAAYYGVARPLLQIGRQGQGQILIRWASQWSDYHLEHSGSLDAEAVWTRETTEPELEGNSYQLTLPFIGQTRYYRLKKE